MRSRVHSRSRRGAFTLIEMAVVTALVAIISVFLIASLLVTVHSDQDTWAECEVVEYMGNTVDRVTAAFGSAALFLDQTNTLFPAGDGVVFQEAFDAPILPALPNGDGVIDYGYASSFGVSWTCRVQLVNDMSLNEVASNFDFNLDGDRLDAAVPVGHFQVLVVDDLGAVRSTTDIGSAGQRVHVVLAAFSGGTPVRVFSEAPLSTTSPVPFVNTPGATLGGVGGVSVGSARSVQLNLTFVRESYPDRNGQPVVHSVRGLRRILFLRSGP